METGQVSLFALSQVGRGGSEVQSGPSTSPAWMVVSLPPTQVSLQIQLVNLRTRSLRSRCVLAS